MRPLVVGTAGHIDHGKSTLVHALTGIDPDRLPEEKRRGITIDLGFAHSTLPNGVKAAFVDVPGHERFVRTMVAGAQGVDVVLFVVAADEGLMAQTREHAGICQLLGLSRAIVALTKSDLLERLDPDWAPLVEEDIRALGPLFKTAPIMRVSAKTGAGLDDLKRALQDAAKTMPARPESPPAFLPIDRVFTVKGHGTVVTGTLLAGALSPEDTVDFAIPAPRTARVLDARRVRGLQVHGRAVTRAVAGQRVAANVVADVAEIPRGAVLVAGGTGAVRQGCLIDVELQVLAESPPLKNRCRLSLHIGTAQSLAAVDLLGIDEAAPGETIVAQLRLDRALPAMRDQRFVLRGFRGLAHGGRTVAGGRVLLVDRKRRRARDRDFVESLLTGPLAKPSEALVREAGIRGLDASWLLLGLGLAKPPFGVLSAGKLFDPKKFVKPAETPAPPDPFADRIEAMLAETNLTPPTVAEIALALRIERTAVLASLRSLARNSRAVKLTEDLFIHSKAAADFRQRILETLKTKGELTTLEIKDLAGTSRKFAIPLCEWLDRERVTLRVGDKRVHRGQDHG